MEEEEYSSVNSTPILLSKEEKTYDDSTAEYDYTTEIAESEPQENKTSIRQQLKKLSGKKRKLDVDFTKNNLVAKHKKLEKNEDCEFEMFGRYIGTQLKKLPVVTALSLQKEIHSLIAEERIKHESKVSETIFVECINDEEQD